jgi:hypothetical protein
VLIHSASFFLKHCNYCLLGWSTSFRECKIFRNIRRCHMTVWNFQSSKKNSINYHEWSLHIGTKQHTPCRSVPPRRHVKKGYNIAQPKSTQVTICLNFTTGLLPIQSCWGSIGLCKFIVERDNTGSELLYHKYINQI